MCSETMFKKVSHRLMIFLFLSSHCPALGEMETKEKASLIYKRLAGVSLGLNTPIREEMESHINNGDIKQAATIATNQDSFYNITLRQWATAISNYDNDPYSGLNDFIAMVIGHVRDDRDFREILYGNFTYRVPDDRARVNFDVDDNNHYAALDTDFVNLRKELVRVEPQHSSINDAAGLLTSRAWAAAHIRAGTNRRAVSKALDIFLCRNIQEFADSSASDHMVRRDVDRNPGGSTVTYMNSCRGCHAGLDGLAAAYNYFDYRNNQIVENDSVSSKTNKNNRIYREGYVSRNANWENLFLNNQNENIRWNGPIQGVGVSELGRMLANSNAFSSCMAKRTFTQVCRRAPEESESELIEDLATKFESNNYKLKTLFADTISSTNCMGK